MGRYWYLLLGPAVAAVAVMMGALPVPGTRLLADLTGLLGAAAAAIAFAVTAWQRPSPGRWPMAIGLAGWGAGQAIWTWHRVVDGRAMTFPDIENLLYLILPVCVGMALLIAARAHGEDHAPDAPTRVLVIDALLLVIGLLGVSWETTVGAATEHTNKTPGHLVLASIYTVTDLLLIMLAGVLALGLRRMWRRPLIWLLAGMGTIGVSDAIYAWCISRDITAPPWSDIGYMLGPWLLLICALVPDRPFQRRDVGGLLLLPYLPLTAAGTLTLVRAATSPAAPTQAEIYVLFGLLVLVVVRQLISQHRLSAAHRTLTRHARSDPLTGVANRAGLAAAFDRATEHDRADDLALLYLDLDWFKSINDTLGHHVGDAVLRTVALRIQACLRNGDVVARLGGDEFAVLLASAPPDPTEITRRIAASIATEISAHDHRCTVTASIGHTTTGHGDTLDTALTRADHQMYATKHASRN